MIVTDCRVNHIENPIGYKLEKLTFSWKVKEASGTDQRKGRIRIAKEIDFVDILFDTGYSEELNSIGEHISLDLKPRTRYYWDVTIISDTGEKAVSSVNYFETAKMDEQWEAEWITCSNDSGRLPEFTNVIESKGDVENARLYISGLGLYEAYIGKDRVGNEFLAPYSNDYNSWVQYQTYDVTEFISHGKEMRILLGNGWYKGRFGIESDDGYYGNEWKLIAELHINYKDGRHKVISTDESWQVKRSSILFSNIYDGEQRNDMLVDEGYENCKLAEKPVGKLSARMSSPVTVQEALKPVEIIYTPAREQVLDLGQNFAGIFKLHVNEEAGKKIHLQFGEILQDGNFFRGNMRTAKAEYIYISDGKEKDIMPHFTYYGYRYVKVQGISNLRKEDFTGLALYSNLQPTGTVKTGNKLVNQLISNTKWGLKSNFIDVPTDCPQRDERFGWTGDAQVFSKTASYLVDSYSFYAKYLYDMTQEQRVLGGKVPNVIPSFHIRDTSSVWGDAACIIPWTLYEFYGDKSILESQYESMKSWVDYVTTVDGEDRAWGRSFHFGDWLALDSETGDETENRGATDQGYIAYIYYMESARLTAKAAEVLGAHDEAEQYHNLAEEIYQYIQYEYFTPRGRCAVNTQTALILALKYNLTADREWTKQRLREMFFNKHDKLQTGFVGTPLLCMVLSENGMDDLAYKLLLNEEYPGWLYSVKLGATTIWERWNSVLEDGTISGTGMNSLNHYAYGSITEWIFAYAAGIRQKEESIGFREVKIAPVLNWDLKKASAAFDSPVGVYKSSWKILDEKHVAIEVSVPFGGMAELTLPYVGPEVYKKMDNPIFGDVRDGVCRLKAGDYHLIYKTDRILKKVYNCDSSLRDLLENRNIRKKLLEALPQLTLIPKTYQSHTLREILLRYAGKAGLPESEEVKSKVLPQLEAMFKKL